MIEFTSALVSLEVPLMLDLRALLFVRIRGEIDFVGVSGSESSSKS